MRNDVEAFPGIGGRSPGPAAEATDSEHTFSVEATTPISSIRIPGTCPCCSQPANERVEILNYNFDSSMGEMVMFGLIGQLFKFVAFGSSSRPILAVQLCQRCHSPVVTYKTLEWIARIGGIGWSILLLLAQTSREEPLIERGAGPIMLTLAPLVLGAILSYLFRSSYDQSKGVALVGVDSGKYVFRARSKEWVRQFRFDNPEARTVEQSTKANSGDVLRPPVEPLDKPTLNEEVALADRSSPPRSVDSCPGPDTPPECPLPRDAVGSGGNQFAEPESQAIDPQYPSYVQPAPTPSPRSSRRDGKLGVAALFVAGIAAALIVGVYLGRTEWRPSASGQRDADRTGADTLSAGTKALIKRIPDTVELRFYVGMNDKTTPAEFRQYADEVEDLLSEYQQFGRGKLQIERYDVAPDSLEEDDAHADGIAKHAVGGENGTVIYLGLSVSHGESRTTLPFLSPERARSLEYDISRALGRVLESEKPAIGFMTSVGTFALTNTAAPITMPNGPLPRADASAVVTDLETDFNLRQIGIDGSGLGQDLNVLVAICPEGISVQTERAIDSFVQRGGSVLAFVDPLRVMERQPRQTTDSNIEPFPNLFRAWGVKMNPGRVVADPQYATTVALAGQTNRVPGILSLSASSMNTADVISAHAKDLLLVFAGAFEVERTSGLQCTPLLTVSAEAALVTEEEAEHPSAVSNPLGTSSGVGPLAIRLSGTFPSAFDAAKSDGTSRGAAPAPRSVPGPEVVLVADSDMLYDQISIEVKTALGRRVLIPRNGNLAFIHALVEDLSDNLGPIPPRAPRSGTHPARRVTLHVPAEDLSRNPDIIRSVTNLLSVPAEEASRRLQTAAEAEYRAGIQLLEEKLKETQAALNVIQANKPANARSALNPEQQQLVQDFQKLQTSEKEKLKAIRRRLRAQLSALERLRGGTNGPQSAPMRNSR